MLDKIYTAENAATLLNCNVRTLRKKLKDNSIKGYKKLGKWYLLHSDIIKFLKS